MFKHAQLETVKAWIENPAHLSMPLHLRIQRAVRELILNGTLGVGRPLPASRGLATSLGVSRDTVEAAYTQLQLEGFIERHVGVGSFVSQRAKRSTRRLAPRKSTGAEAIRLSQRGTAIFESGGLREFSFPRPFAPGVPETRSFPLPTWERLQRQILKEYDSQALAHSPPQGTERLRRAIADYVSLERGARATAERVLVLTSSQQALTLCATVLLDAGDGICVEDPGYPGARKAFEAAGLRCAPVPLDDQGMLVDRLDVIGKDAKAVSLTPSHQFPTGSTLSLERRLAAIEWAHRKRAWILEDDYDSEFHYAGKPTACVQGLDAQERTIYIGTFTKSMFPGLRIAYMVLPAPLVEPMTVARTLLDGHSATLAQLTLARFMEGGHFGAHVRAMRNVYVERRDTLVRLVRKYLGDYVEPCVPVGGLQMQCVLTCDIREELAVAAAAKAGVDLLGLTPLHASRRDRAGFLMGFAAYSPREMEIAVRKLRDVLRALAQRT
ncbi:GntR family transcriptional regulator [Bordetella genomosp. 5]|uniref:MocR-like pyridoxine biosynthesis transcription factor PdxR n=1 Tax=Bordetella genomosp. 5 TaxID=1395608 RepID=UPI000B9E7648|nr:PLP-dependent aminotransferase family protein [Bordetella genomosp. 5]OZI47277.1 GntR family transcriptional regulator [Bordetella genomosp. 5]